MAGKASGKQRPTDQANREQQELPTSYEAARDELVTVVQTLESGGLSLEDSLTLWERGEALALRCTELLDGARERVERALAAADADPGSDALDDDELDDELDDGELGEDAPGDDQGSVIDAQDDERP